MQVLKLSEKYLAVDELVDCFYSFFFLQDTLYSVHRRHRLFSYDNWPETEAGNLSQIILTEYADKDPQRIHSEEFLCDGNDPRVVSNGNEAFILSEGAIHSPIRCRLTLLPTRESFELRYENENENENISGKNWSPFILDKKLFVVESVSPFKISEINKGSGILTVREETEVDFDLVANHDKYSILRCGSNAIESEGRLYGWGHATLNCYTHVPYIWDYHDKEATVHFLNIHSYFKKMGYYITDPCSFFSWDDENFALSLSCSQRDWFHSQKFLNALIIFKKSDFLQKNNFQFSEEPRNKSFIFHALDLDSLIESVYSNGGICNNGLRGCLVCGPSKEIDISKKWTVELCYSSPSKPSEAIAEFDIFLTIGANDTQIVSTKIFGTDGKSTRVRLEFEHHDLTNKALIQTRVFALKKRKFITAYFFELSYE